MFIAIGVITYQSVKQRSALLVPSPKEEAISKNEAKSVCNDQLENQSDTRILERFDGIPNPVDFTTLPEARTFYTMITKAVSAGSNFAGHFTLAYWGCGTDCFGYAVVDTKTGEVVTYNPANVDYHLGDFSLNSRILILEPVYAGQERKFYEIVEKQGGKSRLALTCTEISSEDMFGLPE